MTQIGAITGLSDVAEQQESTANQRQTLRDQLTSLQQAVIHGEATLADPIEEGLIAVYGAELASARFREKATSAFNELSGRLLGQTGQPVLLVHRFLALVPGCYGFGKEPEYQTITEKIFGVLGTDRIIFDYAESEGNLATAYLPTEIHTRLGKAGKDKPGPISISVARTSIRGFGRDSSQPIDLASESGERVEERFMGKRVGRSEPALEVFIGAVEVKDWLSRLVLGGNTYLEIVRASIRLGIEPPTVERFGEMLDKERAQLRAELDKIAAEEAKLGEALALQPSRRAEIIAKAAALGISLTTSES